ncbi:MAG: alanine--tRNA ligase-related protein [Nanoarchaeota archaeon]|nr:alanine--tRNA ligase-related protein [Nanoarchaeota archaeon]
MDSVEIRKRFLEFFRKRGHVVVPSSSLVPDDPSVLLTTAGMQQFKKYYTGELDAKKDFILPDGLPAIGTVSIQKSFRTSDIDEVGDASHLTFFEMMGNFSFGGYFKKEAITWAHEFITEEMKLPISYVTVFQGSDVVPKDEESKKIWRKLGVSDIREEGMDDVFWGPTGSSGPCGPTTEIYCKNGAGQDIEVWNIVFNEFFCTGSREELLAGKAELKPLPSKGIDTGMGLERLAMCLQGTKTIFETDLFQKPLGSLFQKGDLVSARIVADHLRAATFLLADGVRPSNKDAGYILRRLIRRMLVRATIFLNIQLDRSAVYQEYIEDVMEFYGRWYPELNNLNNKADTLSAFVQEVSKFSVTFQDGLRIFHKKLASETIITGKDAFDLYQSHGFPLEALRDIASQKGITIDEKGFESEFERHQEVSRAGQEKKFGGHGLILNTGELKAGDEKELKKATRLHTATHLLQQALRDVLGDSVHQMGSDVTSERTRFDFSFDRKMTSDEIRRVEKIINEKIRENLPVGCKEMSKEEAEKAGALHFFKEKYPDRVKVYFVGRTLEDAYSKEFCGGPHVEHTGEIRGVRVVKEEAVAAGARRIRVVLE